jgi:GntR family transcriptional regulator
VTNGTLFGRALGADDPAPLYLRLQKHIRTAIQRGDLKPLDALPGERDIAEAFGISRVTVRKALSALVKNGLLRQRQGSGTFVAPAPRKVEQPLSRLTSFSEDMQLRGLEPTVTWLGRDLSLPSPQEAMRLLLSPSQKVSRLRRLRLAGGVPMAIEHATIPARYLPDPRIVEHSLYATLEAAGVRPVRALQRLSAANLVARTQRCSALSRVPRH